MKVEHAIGPTRMINAQSNRKAKSKSNRISAGRVHNTVSVGIHLSSESHGVIQKERLHWEVFFKSKYYHNIRNSRENKQAN